MTIPFSSLKTALASSILLISAASGWAGESVTLTATLSPLSEGIARFEAGEDEVGGGKVTAEFTSGFPEDGT